MRPQSRASDWPGTPALIAPLRRAPGTARPIRRATAARARAGGQCHCACEEVRERQRHQGTTEQDAHRAMLQSASLTKWDTMPGLAPCVMTAVGPLLPSRFCSASTPVRCAKLERCARVRSYARRWHGRRAKRHQVGGRLDRCGASSERASQRAYVRLVSSLPRLRARVDVKSVLVVRQLDERAEQGRAEVSASPERVARSGLGNKPTWTRH